MQSGDSKFEALLNQCRSNDVDIKIDALHKLQAEAESGIEISDSDALINVLKACLRTSNQHLTTATLNVLPILLPLIISRPLHLSFQPRSGNGQSSVHSSTSSTSPSSMVDMFTLRQVLNAFLPTGGLFERLGDKERAQVKARETLILLGGYAFRSSASSSTLSTGSKISGKGPETPMAMYERFLRESGLGSKAWKVREQSILVLVHIRRQYHLFPIKPYLSQLVDCLEDTDAHVRDCARASVVEIFSGPAVTDAARADLKKEMTKKGVRKTIVEGVLAKLIGGGGAGGSGSGTDVGSNPQSREGSENGDSVAGGKKEYVPPSLALQSRKLSSASTTATTGAVAGNGMPRTVSQSSVPRPLSRAASAGATPATTPATPVAESFSDVSPVYIASIRDLEQEFAAFQKAYEGKETEHNWAAREQAITRVRGMIKGDVHQRYTDAFMACLKDGFMQWSLKALASLRTTVSTNTCSLYRELAVALGPALDPFSEMLLINLLKMAGFTKKITAQASQDSVTSLITYTSGSPRIFIPLLWQTLQDRNVQARTYGIAHLKAYLEMHSERSKHSIEASGGLETLEKALKKGLNDQNPTVKSASRTCFWVYNNVWQDRGQVILNSLDSMARKQLEKACPNPGQASSVATNPTPQKKTSVAAAIAASRAKAKAIANAPPTLRHQATSAAHIPSSAKRSSSPVQNLSKSTSSTSRPSSPLRVSVSPPAARPRHVSNGMSRTVSNPVISPSHSRARSGGSDSMSPPSPVTDSFTRRMSSSPLAHKAPPNSGSTIRKAMQTALPASPPPSGPTSPSRTSGIRPPSQPQPPARLSSLFLNGDDDSLLLAQAIPIPEDDSDSDGSVNLMSFSSPFEKRRPQLPPASNSQTRSLSPASDSKPVIGISNALSTDSVTALAQAGGQPVVEDALRARAEQAESAAERLLELVEPEDGEPHPTLPPSLLVGSTGANGHATPKIKKPSPVPLVRNAPPVTPMNRATMIMRQAAMFKDSPAHNGKPSSLVDVLQERKNETGWWLRRKSLLARRNPLDTTPRNPDEELQKYIAALEQGDVSTGTLQNMVHFCLENPVTDLMSPLSEIGYPASPSPFMSYNSMPSLQPDLWERNKNFDRFFDALLNQLVLLKDEQDIEFGLMIIWQMLESQSSHFEGRESDIFSLLLRIRYCNSFSVLEATNTIRDALTTRIEPLYGLTTMHVALRTFQAEPLPSPETEAIKASSYAFGLLALGKFTLRLPAEIAEEELPRIKSTLISALNDGKSLVVREAAAAAIIAAQLVLRDETHLFALLDGLADEKKNLLTYLFDKHGARGLSKSSGPSGIDKLEKEMRRLDTRTNTPPRQV
ncbi:hypothetical protein K435DRAFT_651641 [Dendrothele bispora CBS 962.96]|uniref:TOG domain-containing protein n=1 Tax=Dendrothele bispora (strain CBS 962.96) TaxID=1314807 RepID=A0A4S8MKE3_DENBC|nr:hypothetical protein K435DRAFT_651641 [Dendrothele bispora CBS 962.96]